MEKNHILYVQGLTKSWHSGFVSGPSDFSVEGGDVLGILGANGAGKSTLFQMISGNLDKDSGELLLLGKKLHPQSSELKRKIGYLPQNMQLPKWVTGREILEYAASLYGLSDRSSLLSELMETWDCAAYQDVPLAACSHGMQKRIGLALSCIHNPELLILDEPFSGLDLYHIKALTHAVRERKQKGLATILSTHIAPYVASLCTDIRLIQKGKMTGLANWQTQDEASRVTSITAFFD